MNDQYELSLRTYQAEAATTDQVRKNGTDDYNAIMIPLMGLAGETGSLLTEFKKFLRQGEIYKPFEAQVSEELGDILWYVANIASKMGLDLEDIARLNLAKLDDRYDTKNSERQLQRNLFSSDRRFDEGYPETEQLPREIRAEFRCLYDQGVEKLAVTLNGQACGNMLTDNSHTDDGYRFHDVFHFTLCCRLGWSPIMRSLLNSTFSILRAKEFEELI